MLKCPKYLKNDFFSVGLSSQSGQGLHIASRCIRKRKDKILKQKVHLTFKVLFGCQERANTYGSHTGPFNIWQTPNSLLKILCFASCPFSSFFPMNKWFTQQGVWSPVKILTYFISPDWPEGQGAWRQWVGPKKMNENHFLANELETKFKTQS